MQRYSPTPGDLLNALHTMAANGLPTRLTMREFDVGTGPYLRYFEQEVIEDLVSRGGATCRFYEGVYGTGKTHLLQLLHDTGLDHGLAVAWTDLSQSLSLENWHMIVRHILENLVLRIDGEPVRTLPRIIDRLQGAGRANVDALRRAVLPHSGFQKAMEYAASGYSRDDRAWELLSQYLLGARVLISDLRKAGISNVKDPLSARNAEQILFTVANGLRCLGLNGTMLLFDEEERTLTSDKARLRTKLDFSANLIRRTIDGCTTGRLTGTVVAFAVLPGFLEHCAKEYPALGQRIRMHRGEGHPPAWRWPVLTVPSVCSVTDRSAFVDQVAELICRHAQRAGADCTGLFERMVAAGQEELNLNASAGFRRPLMKRLASLATARLEPR